jgi:hypothetical protein
MAIGTRLTVTSVDWEGKHWPCFEVRHQGQQLYLTGDLFEVR